MRRLRADVKMLLITQFSSLLLILNMSLALSFQLTALFAKTRSTTINVEAIDKDQHESSNSSPVGLYVHIPFCRRRCRYCNFAVVPVGPSSTEDYSSDSSSFQRLDEMYTKALLQEIRSAAKRYPDNKKRIPLRSIYFGGGTPSLAPVETLQQILDAILDEDNSPFTIDQSDCEITIEMDPGTFDRDKLRAVQVMGFNRISLGVQSFDDDILESLGRVHRRKDIWESLHMLDDVFGGSSTVNYSMDLISGLPGMSVAKWVETLEIAVHLKPRPVHLSIYDLQIEKNTVFGTWYSSETLGDKTEVLVSGFHSMRGESPVPTNILRLPTEEESAFMYKYASGYLRSKGYEHYEVSSYAWKAPENKNVSFQSRHNQIYWSLEGSWFAFGLGATSFVDKSLRARPRTLFDYQRWVEQETTTWSGSLQQPGDDVVSPVDQLMDTVLKRLRTAEGLSLDWVHQKYGDAHVNAILAGAQLSLDLNLARVDNSTNTLQLADPSGFLYSNSIISNIFVELEEKII